MFAYRFIDTLAQHSKKQAAVAEGGSTTEIQEIPGLEKSLSLIAAEAAACDAMISYFKGEFKPYDWEMPKEQTPVEGRKNGSTIRCFACHNGCLRDGSKCPMCRGSLTLLVFPIEAEET